MYETPFQCGLFFPVSTPKKVSNEKSELKLFTIEIGASPYFFLGMSSKILKISY